MKDFLQIKFDPAQCHKELEEFRQLLASKSDLEENADIKPFFERRHHLSAFLGTFAWNITRYDLLSFQYSLFGDYSCDMVVGDSIRKVYGFIEREDATPNSLFRQQGKKATPEWGNRLEHGFSQVIDWFCKLDDMARTDDFEERFGARNIHDFGLLVIGRDEHVAHPRERRRWEWRSQKVLVDSLLVQCVTYDELGAFLSENLNVIYPATRQSAPPRKRRSGR